MKIRDVVHMSPLSEVTSVRRVFFFLKILRPPISTLFPYTTLFRSILYYRIIICKRRAGNSARRRRDANFADRDRKSTRLNSSHRTISYAVFCLKKKKSARKDAFHLNPMSELWYTIVCSHLKHKTEL